MPGPSMPDLRVRRRPAAPTTETARTPGQRVLWRGDRGAVCTTQTQSAAKRKVFNCRAVAYGTGLLGAGDPLLEHSSQKAATG
jgi:hypothetical protein